VRGLQEPGLGLTGVGEGPALETEQLSLDQGLGNRGAVHIDKGACGARTRAMKGPGQETLPGAGFAEKQDAWKAAGCRRLPNQSTEAFADDRYT